MRLQSVNIKVFRIYVGKYIFFPLISECWHKISGSIMKKIFLSKTHVLVVSVLNDLSAITNFYRLWNNECTVAGY